MVAESVVVIKQLLQMPIPNAADGTVINFDEAIVQITRLFDDVPFPFILLFSLISFSFPGYPGLSACLDRLDRG